MEVACTDHYDRPTIGCSAASIGTSETAGFPSCKFRLVKQFALQRQMPAERRQKECTSVVENCFEVAFCEACAAGHSLASNAGDDVNAVAEFRLKNAGR